MIPDQRHTYGAWAAARWSMTDLPALIERRCSPATPSTNCATPG
ncbi:hypothetical protein [Nonomuraea wenchangensis]|nr:hypothetical protein [Nonomuraea wenchangensis]